MKNDQISLTQSIVTLGKTLGASDVQMADLTPVREEDRLGYRRAVSVMVRLSSGILAQMGSEPTTTYFSHYRTVNRLLDDITLRVSMMLEERGYPSVAVPASQSLPGAKTPYSGIFSHKTAAALSGAGWIGKNALFIHRTFGPALRLGTVLTNAPLAVESGPMAEECKNCDACKKACPAMAIEGVNFKPGLERKDLFDAHGCSEYMKEAYQHIGRGVVCGLCIVSCPHFRKNLRNL